MTEFTAKLDRKYSKIFTDTAEALNFGTKMVEIDDTHVTIRFVYGKTIPALILLKLGRLVENQLIFNEEVNIPQYWKELFDGKQQDIITKESVV